MLILMMMRPASAILMPATMIILEMLAKKLSPVLLMTIEPLLVQQLLLSTQLTMKRVAIKLNFMIVIQDIQQIW